MSGGGGSTNSTVTQSNLPKYAQPYYEALMDRGLTESQQAYTPYTGQRVADQTRETRYGLNQMGNYAQSGTPYLDQASAMQGNVGQQAMNLAGYQSANISNSYNGPVQGNYDPSNYQAQQLGFGKNGVDTLAFGKDGVNQVGTNQFNAQAAQQYMSPYMDAVVQKTQTDALKNFQIEQQARNLNAAKTGSFGGSRAAVQNQMATGQLQSNLTDIMTQGQQSAFENAQSQFNADQGRSLTAQQANQQAGLTMGQANQQAGLTMGQANQQAALNAAQMNEQSRQYGYGATEDAYQQAAQLGLTAQQANEQFRQSGKQLGLAGLDLANQSSQQLAAMQGQYDDSALARAKAMLGIGSTKEDYTQQNLDQSYNDFINQRDSEKQNLQFLSSLLQGVPVSANSDVTSTAGGGNNLAGLLGSAGGLQALMALGKT